VRLRPWSKIPAWWAYENQLDLFRSGKYAGESIATLRVMLCLASLTRTHNSEEVEISIHELAKAAALSLPTTRAGIKLAHNLGFIMFRRGGGLLKSRFRLLPPKNTQIAREAFFKLPGRELAKGVLSLPKRGNKGLAALKIYLLLLATRPNNGREAVIGYDKMWLRTGVQMSAIRDALSLLALAGLIVVNKTAAAAHVGAHNVYPLRGDFSGKREAKGASPEDPPPKIGLESNE
jgi:hypothetical protein